MAEMTRLHSAVEELKNLERKIYHLKRVRRIRGILKVVGVGFFLPRNIDQRISRYETQKTLQVQNIEPTITQTLASESAFTGSTSRQGLRQFLDCWKHGNSPQPFFYDLILFPISIYDLFFCEP